MYEANCVVRADYLLTMASVLYLRLVPITGQILAIADRHKSAFHRLSFELTSDVQSIAEVLQYKEVNSLPKCRRRGPTSGSQLFKKDVFIIT